jgi:adenine-specific DNA-methyltransferase
MTELVWDGKYRDNKKVAPVRIPLPFQTIETVNESVQNRQRTLDMFAQGKATEWRNRLIWGDKKYVLPSLMDELPSQVGLIYIDPPFDTGADFSYTATIPDNPESEEYDGASFVKEPSMIELKAYRDTWGKGLDGYLQWFYETVLSLRELLREDGSIYVHLDWRLIHYVKVVLDEVFGYENFINEIIWQSAVGDTSAKNKKFIKSHDSILFYSKGSKWIWNDIFQGYGNASLKLYNLRDEKGIYQLIAVDNPGGGGYVYDLGFREKKPANGYRMPKDTALRWLQDGILVVEEGKVPRRKQYKSEEGVRCRDVWTDITGSVKKNYPTEKPEPLIERIIRASSNEDDIILDCFCGGGTTPVVAERLARRWIACDLSRFAIHTTRKRLLGTSNVRPFVVQNLGKYERQTWQATEFAGQESKTTQENAYRHFILQLFRAEPVEGFIWLHGARNGRLVHVGAVDAPVALGDVKAIIQEFWKAVGKSSDVKTNGVDILGWEFAFDINETAIQQAAASNVDIKFKKIPREVLDKKAIEQGDVHFFELAGLDVKTKVIGQKVELVLKEFIIPPDDVPEDVRQAITHWSQWIDYWAVDWNFRDDTFHNEWQSYRTKKEPSIALETSHTYECKGTYMIVVKVIDILGNDTTKALTVKIA